MKFDPSRQVSPFASSHVTAFLSSPSSRNERGRHQNIRNDAQIADRNDIRQSGANLTEFVKMGGPDEEFEKKNDDR